MTNQTTESRRTRRMVPVVAFGLVIALTLAALPSPARALRTDPLGVRGLPKGFSVVTEDDLANPANPRSCGNQCGSGLHFAPVCLEQKTTLECSNSFVSPVCPCVTNLKGIAIVSFETSSGLFKSGKGGDVLALIAQMAARREALVQVYRGDEKSLGLANQMTIASVASISFFGKALTDFVVGLDVGVGSRIVVKVAFNNSPLLAIDDTLALAPSLASVVVTGPLGCTPDDEDATIRVTLTQEGNGAIAQGVWRGACTPADRWKTEVRTGADPGASCVGTPPRRLLPSLARPFVEKLVPGAGEACALAEFHRGGRVTRTEQWCNAVELVVE